MPSRADTLKIHTLKKGVIERFLKRLKRRDAVITGPELDEVLREILHKANEFVPSEAGSILLDDPHRKSVNLDEPHHNLLHFVACFGSGSEAILGGTRFVGVNDQLNGPGHRLVIWDTEEKKLLICPADPSG